MYLNRDLKEVEGANCGAIWGKSSRQKEQQMKSPVEGHIAGCSKKARAAKAGWVRGAMGNDFRDGHSPAYRVLNIRRTLDFILWKMGSCWSVARANFKAVWLSLLFLKMLQFSISFRIKFKWFILAHKVFIVRHHRPPSRMDPSLQPNWITCSSLDRSWWFVFWCLSAYCLPCEETLPLSSQGHWLCFRGSFLCSSSALCLVLSPFPSLATLYSSHGVLEHVAFF